jgi:hypothetical protein
VGCSRYCGHRSLSTNRRSSSRTRHSGSSDRRFRTSRSGSQHRSSHSGHRHPTGTSTSHGDDTSLTCWYHQRFGRLARNCSSPCSYQHPGNLTQLTPTAAHVCTPPSGRLFVTDRFSWRRFLIDTGSDLCVFPHILVTST